MGGGLRNTQCTCYCRCTQFRAPFSCVRMLEESGGNTSQSCHVPLGMSCCYGGDCNHALHWWTVLMHTCGRCRMLGGCYRGDAQTSCAAAGGRSCSKNPTANDKQAVWKK